jgi:hypothetical protein
VTLSESPHDQLNITRPRDASPSVTPLNAEVPTVTVNEDLAAFLAAVRDLHSSDPAIRRPAIAVLLQLARGRSSVQTDAECVLTEEFGPYAVTEGLGGCSGPIEFVEVCDGNCRACVWLWQDQPVSCPQQVPAPQPTAPTACRSRQCQENV